MELKECELIVMPGRRPVWKTLLATVFFSFMIYCLYQLGCICWDNNLDEYPSKQLANLVEGIALSLSGGISFAVMKTVLIDVDKDKLVSRFFIGPFQKDVLTKVPALEYVAVFRNAKDFYEVNLWYKGNKHYKMYDFDDSQPAFQFAQMVAQKLNLDLLDATERGNSKWIEKTPA